MRLPASNQSLQPRRQLLLGAGAAGLMLLFIHGFYGNFYSVHPDLAGGVLSGKLAVELGPRFDDYSLYFPPIERLWFSAGALLAEASGLRLDLAMVLLTSLAIGVSAYLGLAIRSRSLASAQRPARETALFALGSALALVVLPIIFMNAFGLREHLVILGLFPYLCRRFFDPAGQHISPRMRLFIGLWLGAMLLFKYLYCVVVLLVEITDALYKKRPLLLFRIENLVSGTLVATYLAFWLIFNPQERAAISLVVSAIDANLIPPVQGLIEAAINLAPAAVFFFVGARFKLPLRQNLIGLALVLGAGLVAFIQARWYVQHIFAISAALIVWLWLLRARANALWLVLLSVLIAVPVIRAFAATFYYQASVNEVSAAMAQSGVSLDEKKVGVLIMNPSPFNQVLAQSGAMRWNSSVNNSYVASALQDFDIPANAGRPAPPVLMEKPGWQMLHDDMLSLWEDAPPDALILDTSRSWPLKHIKVRWEDVFAKDARFKAILADYEPVMDHKGELTEFRYFERTKPAP